ncbi:MAG: hypothetical protein HZC42_07960 [Candidatus Eisenbacteria bacterium]|nr:hypothetical protein [Candidatus Eisenbacteria bacterium]
MRVHQPNRLTIVLAALASLLIGSDPCIVGALAGNTSMACVLPARTAPAAAADAGASSCHEGGAVGVDARAAASGTQEGDHSCPDRGHSCCEVKPPAPGSPEQAVVLPAVPVVRVAHAEGTPVLTTLVVGEWPPLS